ncbi:MAG TPA: ROK family protein [Candidatus Marinimicrobia bacterium]|nr:ROK family protein [Candidatus Neomarinimicrobiota bacterium]
MEKKQTIGIDLGGTKFHVGIVSEQNEIIGETQRYSSRHAKSADELLDSLANGVLETLDINGKTLSDIGGVGIGSPGPLDPYSGKILNTLNLKVFRNFPLKRKLEKKLGISVFVDNDANCFALGEQRGGEARGKKHVMAITLGTGFGFALIINGEILHGATGTATEIARIPYLDGEYEDFISGRGLAKMYKNLSGKTKKPEDIGEGALHGDAFCIETFAEFGSHLAMTLVPLVSAFDPEILVVGGSIAANWEYFSPALEETLRPYLFEPIRKNLIIAKSQLGECATIVGAAGLIHSKFSI